MAQALANNCNASPFCFSSLPHLKQIYSPLPCFIECLVSRTIFSRLPCALLNSTSLSGPKSKRRSFGIVRQLFITVTKCLRRTASKKERFTISGASIDVESAHGFWLVASSGGSVSWSSDAHFKVTRKPNIRKRRSRGFHHTALKSIPQGPTLPSTRLFF